MRLQDLAIYTNTPVDTDKALLEKFRAHDRVIYDPKTDLYSYRVRLGFSSIVSQTRPDQIIARLQCSE